MIVIINIINLIIKLLDFFESPHVKMKDKREGEGSQRDATVSPVATPKARTSHRSCLESLDL